jgi:hypothetical protein
MRQTSPAPSFLTIVDALSSHGPAHTSVSCAPHCPENDPLRQVRSPTPRIVEQIRICRWCGQLLKFGQCAALPPRPRTSTARPLPQLKVQRLSVGVPCHRHRHQGLRLAPPSTATVHARELRSAPRNWFTRSAGSPRQPDIRVDTPHGFYWTEGNRGVGWAVDAIPPLKCSSGLGIISPPGGVDPGQAVDSTPTIEDAEALQGFHRGWTRPASVLSGGNGARWRLVGSAVSVPVAQWIGTRLARKAGNEDIDSVKLPSQHFWPAAGYGGDGARYQVSISEWPGRKSHQTIMEFLSPEAPPLSVRASSGFLGRLLKSNLRVPEQFIEGLFYSVSSASHHADHRSRNEHANVAHARAGQFA